MKIIAIEKELPGAAAEQFQQLAEAEARKVWEFQQAEFIRESYFIKNETRAVLILEAENILAAEAKLAQLPYVKESLITFELIPLKPYPGLSRLFKEESK